VLVILFFIMTRLSKS